MRFVVPPARAAASRGSVLRYRNPRVINLLDCGVMHYAWGSRTAIAELEGRPSPSDTPDAELSMGAHPSLPSTLGGRSLIDVLAAAPDALLGAASISQFGPRLPFLMKVLAAAQPLSLQAHPDAAQARAGFVDEDRRGIPRNASNRNYRDDQHKPELLAALTPVDALCGFREASDRARLFAAIDAGDLERGDLRDVFARLMVLEPARVTQITSACAGKSEAAFRWAARLAELYPGDPGVIVSLLLNVVHLGPGEAIYLEAGNLHAYLGGVGVEIMASSDNVLRGGLTKKHVDVGELLHVLRFDEGPVHVHRPRAVSAHERVYDTPATEFRLSVCTPGAELEADGPEILLCTEGAMNAGGVALPKGRAAFVSADTGRYRLEGRGTVYRAALNT